MKKMKRLVSMLLILTMVVTGVNLDGFVLEVQAGQGEEAYLGYMLTEEEYRNLSYGMVDQQREWWQFENASARYKADGSSIDGVLKALKERDNFYWKVEDENEDYNAELSGTNTGYYLVLSEGTASEGQSVSEVDDVNGVVFGADLYCEDESLPEDEQVWKRYTFGDLSIGVWAPIAFVNGNYSDITLGCYTDGVIMMNEATVRGTVSAMTGVDNKTLYVGRGVHAYGLTGFDTVSFLPVSRQDDSGNTWVDRRIRFDSTTGKEEISLGNIRCAVYAENGVPAEAVKDADLSGVNLEIAYHEGYIPKLTGDTKLGITNDGVQENANALELEYIEDFEADEWVRHHFSGQDQVVSYENANAFVNSRVRYLSPEGVDIWYQIDADGRLYADEKFSVERYANEADYLGDFHDAEAYQREYVAGADAIGAAMKAIAYDSEINSDTAYYILNVNYPYAEDATEVGSVTVGSMDVPAGIRGLRVVGNSIQLGNEWYNTVAGISSLSVQEGTQVELVGQYKGIDGRVEISGGGKVRVSGVRRLEGDLIMTDDSVCVLDSSTITGKVSADPADGTIGTLKLENGNYIGGIDGFKQVEFAEAYVEIRDSQGIVFYGLTNGYDGQNNDTANGGLVLNIGGAIAGKNVPEFHKPLSLGERKETAKGEDGQSYPVYSYWDEDEDIWYYYAKVGDVFYLVPENSNNRFDTATSEQASGDVLAELQKSQPDTWSNKVRINYTTDLDAEEREDVMPAAGVKVLNVSQTDVALAGNIAENVSYDNPYDYVKDIDGSVFVREDDRGISIGVYKDNEDVEEHTAQWSFENDRMTEEQICCDEAAYTMSAGLVNIWLEYLSSVKGYEYFNVGTDSDGEINMGDLTLPETAAGLMIRTNTERQAETPYIKKAAVDSVTATADGQMIRVEGSYSKGFDFHDGGHLAQLLLTNARINGTVNAEDAAVSVSGSTVVSTLQKMRRLVLNGGLTIEKQLAFAEEGRLDITGDDAYGRILAKTGATVEIPNVDCVNADSGYANGFEVYEEVKDGKRPQIKITGQLNAGEMWNKIHLNLLRVDGNTEIMESMGFNGYYYGEGDEAYYNLIQIDGKVYECSWDTSGNEERISTITIDGETWNIQGLGLIDRTEQCPVDGLQKDCFENMLNLRPYDAEKAADAECLADMYTNADYDIMRINDLCQLVYDADEKVTEYYLAPEAATDNNFRRIAVYYAYQKEGFYPNGVELYPIEQYHLDREEGDTRFADEAAYKDEGLNRTYAMYSITNAIVDEQFATSAHTIASILPGTGSFDLADTKTIKVQTGSYTYTGQAIQDKPVVTFTSGAGAEPYVLKEGTDYVLSYSNNINAGQANVTITAVAGGNFVGSTTAVFTIAPKTLGSGMVAAIADQTYSRAALTPAVVVRDGAAGLTLNKDYTVTYQNNVNTGTATVVISAKPGSNYTGSVSTTFKINPKQVSALTIKGFVAKKYYTGSAITQRITVYDGNTKLTADEYTVKYSNNKRIGTKASLTITGKGNYTGKLKKTFEITIRKNTTTRVNGYVYKVTKVSSNGTRTVKLTKYTRASKNSVLVPATITIGGATFKVTAIDTRAFKYCKGITRVTIGKNVTSIGREAFANNRKLKKIQINSTVLKTVGRNAFKGIPDDAVIKVPSKKLKAYKKLLKGKGQSDSVEIKK